MAGGRVYASGETQYIGNNRFLTGSPVHHAVDGRELHCGNNLPDVEINTSALLFKKYLNSPGCFQRESEYQQTGQPSSTGRQLPCLNAPQGRKSTHRLCLLLGYPQSTCHTTGASPLQDCTAVLAVSELNHDSIFHQLPCCMPTHVFCSDTYAMKPSETAALKLSEHSMPTGTQKHPIEHDQTNVPHEDAKHPERGGKRFSASPSPDSTTSPKQQMARTPRRRARHGQKHGSPAEFTMPDKLTVLHLEKPPFDPVPKMLSATVHTPNAHYCDERPLGRSGNSSEDERHSQGDRPASELSGRSRRAVAQGLAVPGNASQWMAMEERGDRLSRASEQCPSPSHNSCRFTKVGSNFSAALLKQGNFQDCRDGLKAQPGMT